MGEGAQGGAHDYKGGECPKELEAKRANIANKEASFHAKSAKRMCPVCAYEWLDAHSPAIENPKTTLRDVVGSRQEVAVGVLVHQALLWWTRQQPRVDRIEHFLPSRLERWAQNLQLSTQEQVHICALARAQLEKFCVSEVGIWALREHDSHVSELALTGLIDGEIRNVIIDRMFVDGGERWILDYKSSQLDQSTTNRTEMIARYRPQLSLYKTICSALYDEPIRTALILTDSAELVEI